MARLQAMLTGTPGGSPAQVMQRLKKRYDAIRRNPGAKDPEGGPIAYLNHKLIEVQQKLAKLSKEKDEMELACAELEKTGGSSASA